MEKQLLQTVRLQVMQKYLVFLALLASNSHSKIGTTATLAILKAGL